MITIMPDEEEKTEQLAISVLPFDDRLTLAKSLKKAVESTNDIEEKRYYKTRIRELFTQEEWDRMVQEKQNQQPKEKL